MNWLDDSENLETIARYKKQPLLDTNTKQVAL